MAPRHGEHRATGLSGDSSSPLQEDSEGDPVIIYLTDEESGAEKMS